MAIRHNFTFEPGMAAIMDFFSVLHDAVFPLSVVKIILLKVVTQNLEENVVINPLGVMV
jgi:hypothetical protein